MTAVAAGAATVLLLPERRRFAGQALAADVGRALARGEAAADGEPGEAAQLKRWFDLLPRGWPVAAITRARDADDARLHTWLRADPCWVRADMTGARVMAVGELGLSRGEADALVAPLRTLFGDAGMPISAPDPSRWYLAMAPEAKPPQFAPPENLLGDDLFAHLPGGPDGRRWRALLNEAQILLHNNPVNAARVAAGKPPANSLCFWGSGRLPDHVRTTATVIESEESLLASLAKLATPLPPAGAPSGAKAFAPEGAPAGAGAAGVRLVDLRAVRDWPQVEARIRGALAAKEGGGVDLDFADGARRSLHRRHGWRFWRRTATSLA